jgi:hypothetical protein
MFQDLSLTPLNLSRLALMRFKLWAEKLFETAITVHPAQPFGGRKGVLVVGHSSSVTLNLILVP